MKHVLFTTTALVVLGSTSAFADVTWSGSADLSYNDGNESLQDGINLDVDLDVTLSNAGGFAATIGGAMEGGPDAGAINLKTEDVTITTPVATINYGEVVEAAEVVRAAQDHVAQRRARRVVHAHAEGILDRQRRVDRAADPRAVRGRDLDAARRVGALLLRVVRGRDRL